MDIVFVRDLRIETVIGIWEWERHIKQIVRVDLEMGADIRRAAETDSIEHALNYKDVAKRVVAHAEGAGFSLVEALADSIAAIVVKEFGVRWVRVTVAKPGAVEGSKEVGVVIERGPEDYD